MSSPDPADISEPGMTRSPVGSIRRIPKASAVGSVQAGTILGSKPTGSGAVANRSHPACRSSSPVSHDASQSAVQVSWFACQ